MNEFIVFGFGLLLCIYISNVYFFGKVSKLILELNEILYEKGYVPDDSDEREFLEMFRNARLIARVDAANVLLGRKCLMNNEETLLDNYRRCSWERKDTIERMVSALMQSTEIANTLQNENSPLPASELPEEAVRQTPASDVQLAQQ